MGIKSAPQSLWESVGSGALSIKGTPHLQLFFNPWNHYHCKPWIFCSNLNCLTCISQIVRGKWIKSCYIFHTRRVYRSLRASVIGCIKMRVCLHKRTTGHSATTPQKNSTEILLCSCKISAWGFPALSYSNLNTQTEILIKSHAATWLFNGVINWLWNSHVKSWYIVSREFEQFLRK